MFDKEIEAIAKCTELVKDLDEEAKYRVIKYLIERFGIGSKISPVPQIIHTANESQDAILIANGGDNQNKDHNRVIDDYDYPSLKELVVKNYPKNEGEWVLCYSFFASKHGSDTFTREDVVNLYKENKRFSSSARANLGNNLNACIKKDWLKTHNDDFILKDDGLKYAKEVLAGRSTSREVKPVKRRTTQPTNEDNG